MPKKTRKPKVADLPAKSKSKKQLNANETESIRGGRAGGDREKYMEYKLKDVIIS